MPHIFCSSCTVTSRIRNWPGAAIRCRDIRLMAGSSHHDLYYGRRVRGPGHIRGLMGSSGGVLAMTPRPLAPGAGLDAARWADQELGGALLEDVRVNRRLKHYVQVQTQAPQASFPKAAQSDQALAKGNHRLIDRPDNPQVTPHQILASEWSGNLRCGLNCEWHGPRRAPRPKNPPGALGGRRWWLPQSGERGLQVQSPNPELEPKTPVAAGIRSSSRAGRPLNRPPDRTGTPAQASKCVRTLETNQPSTRPNQLIHQT